MNKQIELRWECESMSEKRRDTEMKRNRDREWGSEREIVVEIVMNRRWNSAWRHVSIDNETVHDDTCQ